MKTKVFLIVLLLSIFLFSSLVSGIDEQCSDGEQFKIYVFYGKGCPHCDRLMKVIDKQCEEHSHIELISYEIYFDEKNRELFDKFAGAFNHSIQGVPTTFIGDEVFVGENTNDILEKIKECSEKKCIDSFSKINNGEDGFKKTVAVGAVVGAAVVDAINPCAFAVLIILLSTILVSKNRRKAFFAGIAFACAVFISYFLMGLGLYSAISVVGVSHWFYIVVACLAIIIGLFNLKDYLWYGKWFKMEVPDSWRPRMKMLIKSVTSVPGAFFIGFVVSLFLLPCTSGPYIVILGLLSKVATRNYALLMLVLYNLVFIIPMLLITFLVYFGITTTEKAEQWRQRELKVLHLIAGAIILLLGVGMIVALLLGWL